MLQALREPAEYWESTGAKAARRAIGSVGLALAVAVGYFLAARLSLFLISPDGVAVFWPAAGVSSGVLIARGRDARWPVAVGTIAATVVANLTSDRTIWGSMAFALCNAGEALLTAWLIQRYFGSEFSLGRLSQVLGLLAAAIFGTAVSGIGGAAAYWLFHSPDAPVFLTWRHWFASDAIGIVTVAPLIIGLASIDRVPPRRELIEGAAALASVAGTIGIIIFLPPQRWGTMVPVELLSPMLLWVTARCRPVFAAAAVFLVSLTIVWSLTFRVGQFGDVNPSMDERIFDAQAAILGLAVFTYVLAALFAERRQHEVIVMASEARLQEALVAGGVAAFDWDVRSDLLRSSESAAQILGLDPQKPLSASSFLARIHPEDRERFQSLVRSLRPGNSSYSTMFRYIRPDGREVWLEETSKAEFDAAGRVVGLKGLTLDITERKRAEQRQKVLMGELDHRVKNVLARVAVVAASTGQASSSVKEFVRSLDGRIQSMADAHSLLSQSGWNGAGLADLVRNQLAPYATDANMTITGTNVMLTSAATQALAMVLHELVTNAAKYGALSAPSGRVSVSWERKLDENGAASLIFEWRELGSPRIKAQARSGYGTSLIRELVPHELGGAVDLVFASEGVSCKMEIPLESA
jgi:PAS domain S-box-containing protein